MKELLFFVNRENEVVSIEKLCRLLLLKDLEKERKLRFYDVLFD